MMFEKVSLKEMIKKARESDPKLFESVTDEELGEWILEGAAKLNEAVMEELRKKSATN